MSPWAWSVRKTSKRNKKGNCYSPSLVEQSHYDYYYYYSAVAYFGAETFRTFLSLNGSRIVASTSREHHSAQNFTPDRMEATKIPKTATRSPKMKKNIDMFPHQNLQISSFFTMILESAVWVETLSGPREWLAGPFQTHQSTDLYPQKIKNQETHELYNLVLGPQGEAVKICCFSHQNIGPV